SRRRRHTRFSRDWSSDVCSSDLDRNHCDRSRKIIVLVTGESTPTLRNRGQEKPVRGVRAVRRVILCKDRCDNTQHEGRNKQKIEIGRASCRGGGADTAAKWRIDT